LQVIRCPQNPIEAGLRPHLRASGTADSPAQAVIPTAEPGSTPHRGSGQRVGIGKWLPLLLKLFPNSLQTSGSPHALTLGGDDAKGVWSGVKIKVVYFQTAESIQFL